VNPSRYLPRPLPPPLEGLATLALDLRWTRNDAAVALWGELDPELWRALGNPWLILETVSERRLEQLARDGGFLRRLQQHLAAREAQVGTPAWWSGLPEPSRPKGIAFFSMEFGVSEALPIYSGGLGILAGDYLKAASDLGAPVVGVGLLYQVGYFRQALDREGNQLAFFPYNDPTMLPVLPLRDPQGEWEHTTVQLPGRTLRLRAWQAQVGRVVLYLLDSNDPLNRPGDRGLTGELYGGGSETRLQQELILGIGGWRLLDALGIECEVCHLNEGHTAFAVLERARSFMERTSRPFATALRCTRAGNVFTTHTAVSAGIDRFPAELAEQYLAEYAAAVRIGTTELLALGRARADDRREPFNMAFLALRGSGRANGVSRLHESVSRRIFEPVFPRVPEAEVPIGHVTNGVHVPSWDSAAARALWAEACGDQRWSGDLRDMEASFRRVPDEVLWRLRCDNRRALVEAVRWRKQPQREPLGGGPSGSLDPAVLTLGFARRFATYKRPNLLLHDPGRLTRLLGDRERPMQLVLAGKAHPQDEPGKRLVREWSDYARRPEVSGRVVFLEDYDMALASELVQGVDLWINTPRRPWEASGTSGMKVLVNAGLNLSEIDGWWAEAFSPEVGWAIGDGRERGEDAAWDAAEADALYSILEREVGPDFYDRGPGGVPSRWVARMRESMALLTPRFSANRMVRQYAVEYHLPAAGAVRARCADGGARGEELERRIAFLAGHWGEVRFESASVVRSGDEDVFDVQLHLGAIDAQAVQVELFADGSGGAPPVRMPMSRGEELAGRRGFRYTARVPTSRPASDYTPRAVAWLGEDAVPLEAPPVLWQR
jgi:starch phosphorylase